MAFDPAISTLTATRGMAWSQACIAAEDADGTVRFDLTGGSLEMTVKRFEGDATAWVGTVTVTDAAEGEFTLSLTAEQTVEMTAGSYRYDVIFTDSFSVLHPILTGALEMRWSPTPDS